MVCTKTPALTKSERIGARTDLAALLIFRRHIRASAADLAGAGVSALACAHDGLILLCVYADRAEVGHFRDKYLTTISELEENIAALDVPACMHRIKGWAMKE